MSSEKDAPTSAALEKNQPVAPPSPSAVSMPTSELISRTVAQVTELGKTQIQLAMAEARADLKAELRATKGLGIAAWAGLSAIQLLLVAAAFALAQVIPGWAAALALAGVLALVAGIAGAWGWSRRVRTPMERTRREIEEDVQWAKEKIA